uniref:Head GIN domain-containing protein n=3 Tax=unclassified Prevotella TaxID=2638335 RepID=A0AB33JM68_9BACT
MKKILLLALIVAFGLGAVGCRSYSGSSSEEQIGRRVRVRPFEQIETRLLGTVIYQQADTFGLKLEGDKKMVDGVQVSYEGNRIVLTQKNNVNLFSFGSRRSGKLTLYISSPDLIGADLVGAGSFEVRGKLDTDTLRLVLRGAGDMNIPYVVCDYLNAELRGAGDMTFGHVETVGSDVQVRGVGDIDIRLKNAARARFGVHGTGDIDANLERCGMVDCELVGVGDITLKGDARQLKQSLRGTGDIDVSGLLIGK